MNRFLCLVLFISSIAFSQGKKELITVYFDSNSFELAEKEENKLISFFSNPEITISSLVIDGFCDDIGTFEHNLVLSEKRAKTVAGYLKTDFQLVPNAISGKGEVELQSTPANEIEKARMDNRRVSIAIEYTTADKSAAKESIEPITKNTPAAVTGYKTFDTVLKIGDKIIIKNLVFKASRTAFEDVEKAEAELKKIVAFFHKNPTIKFEINGHVCCITKSFKDARDKDTGFNNLSESRAKRIYDYFLANGIAKERMMHKGYGRQFPIPNIKESENKRVEIVIAAI